MVATVKPLLCMCCQVPVIAAKYAGKSDLPAAVEAAVRAQQNNDTAVMYGLAAARILEKVRKSGWGGGAGPLIRPFPKANNAM